MPPSFSSPTASPFFESSAFGDEAAGCPNKGFAPPPADAPKAPNGLLLAFEDANAAKGLLEGVPPPSPFGIGREIDPDEL